MENRKYDPQFESLKDFWNAQQERLSLLSGMKITDAAVNLAAAFGESEIMVFEKLMQTQKHLTEMMAQSPVASTASVAAPLAKRISNPVIDSLDLSDPKTVRRFEIHPYECDGGTRGEAVVPARGILLLPAREDSRVKALAEFFMAKGMTVKQIEKNLSEEEAAVLIAETAKEGPITGMLIPANIYGEEEKNYDIYEHTMTVVYLIKHYTIYIRALKPNFRSMVLFMTFLDGKLGFTGENNHYAYAESHGLQGRHLRQDSQSGAHGSHKHMYRTHQLRTRKHQDVRHQTPPLPHSNHQPQ